MQKAEKEKIKSAIKLIMSDDGFDDGIDILCKLVGTERVASVAMKDPSVKVVSIFDTWKDSP